MTQRKKQEMTLERKETLSKIMGWFWARGNTERLISKSDYEFVYDIWNNGLSYYGTNVQERLNKIRAIYLADINGGY